MFKISISNKAEKSLKSFEARLAKRINDAILYLRDNPVPTDKYDVTKVAGEQNTYRIRIGIG